MIDYNISAPKEKFFGLRMVFCLNVDEENGGLVPAKLCLNAIPSCIKLIGDILGLGRHLLYLLLLGDIEDMKKPPIVTISKKT